MGRVRSNERCVWDKAAGRHGREKLQVVVSAYRTTQSLTRHEDHSLYILLGMLEYI